MGEKDNMPLEINYAWCKGCGLCSEFCPRGVLAISLGKVEILKDKKCISCGICEQICPDYVIHVRRGQA